MNRGRGMAVAALLLAALAAAGCGLGPGAGLGEVKLTVTRDYGARVLVAIGDEVAESDTVMRVLDRHARVGTRYGGAFVQSIDGLGAGEEHGRPHDWLYYVNGVEAPVGAADFQLRGGDTVWWDYRDWSAAIHVPAVVGSWPQPFASGYEGRRRPVAVRCLGEERACRRVRDSLDAAGARLGGDRNEAIRVLVGPWARVRRDDAAAQLEGGPAASGVFAEFRRRGRGFDLWGLDEGGTARRRFGTGTGLVAATRRYEAPPVWIVTGASAEGVDAAAALLGSSSLRNRYAVAVTGGRATPLPVPLDGSHR